MVTLTPVILSSGLSERELRRRAAKLRLVLSDVDGTLTDGGVYYSERGEELKKFNLRDGMGVERLRERGIETAFVTREASPIVQRRAEKLGVALFASVRDKAAALPGILSRFGLSNEHLAYIGDDVNDLDIIRAIRSEGLVAAPADALLDVRTTVHHVCAASGGQGAFRELAELIIRLLGSDRMGRGNL